MKKVVSVIIPCFNKEKYIKEAIDSVIGQTYKNIEIVCVNDGSEDNSLKILEELQKKYPSIVLIDEKKNQGVVQARNLAIDTAKGDYILPLDADDTIEPSYVEKAVKVLEENSDIGIVYCLARLIGKNKSFWQLPPFNKSDILYNNCIFCTAMFRKTDFIKAGKYKSYMNIGPEDWDLWLSFLEIGLKPYRIPEVLFNYRMQDKGTRTEVTKNTSDIWQLNLVKNHMNLYLNDRTFLNRIFARYDLDIKTQQLEIRNKKYKKYKKLFNILLILCVSFSIVILVLIFLKVAITFQLGI